MTTDPALGDNEHLPARVFNRLIGSIVPPVVDSVDVELIVERIDFNEVVNRVDLNAMMEKLDLDEVLDRVDPDRLLDRIDVDHLMDRIDVDRLLGRIDVNQLMDRIDVDRLLGRVDLDALVGRVDLNAAIDGVDLDAVVDRVDLNRALDRVDVNSVVERTELGTIIARSTTGVFGQLLDGARTQIMTVDQVVQGVPARLLRGADREFPADPSGEATSVELPRDRILTSEQRAVTLQHRFSGSISRFLAFLIDQFLMGVLFSLGWLLTSAAVNVITGHEPNVPENRLLIVAIFACWFFVYMAGSLAATGRTIGMAILGLLVVDSDGTRVSGRRAALRTVCFPISFLLFGIGFLIGLFRRDRRELHDLLAGTAVIYDWDAATAQRRA